MILVKILKRKDASSIIVAIVIATIIGGFLMQAMYEPASKIVGGIDSPGAYGPYGPEGGPGWKLTYLQPAVHSALQLIALELLAWLTIGVVAFSKPIKGRRKK